VYHEKDRAVPSIRRRFAILSMAACVVLSGVAASGCGVREGIEKVEDAKQAKKQVEKQRDELEKKLQEGQ
jgi:orotate phosphoribosyltransferase-like protein